MFKYLTPQDLGFDIVSYEIGEKHTKRGHVFTLPITLPTGDLLKLAVIEREDGLFFTDAGMVDRVSTYLKLNEPSDEKCKRGMAEDHGCTIFRSASNPNETHIGFKTTRKTLQKDFNEFFTLIIQYLSWFAFAYSVREMRAKEEEEEAEDIRMKLNSVGHG